MYIMNFFFHFIKKTKLQYKKIEFKKYLHLTSSAYTSTLYWPHAIIIIIINYEKLIYKLNICPFKKINNVLKHGYSPNLKRKEKTKI